MVNFSRYTLCDAIYTCFRHPRVKTVFKTVLKMWSQICGKMAYVYTKQIEENSAKNDTKKMKASTILADSRTKLVLLVDFLDNIFKIVFPK